MKAENTAKKVEGPEEEDREKKTIKVRRGKLKKAAKKASNADERYSKQKISEDSWKQSKKNSEN